MMLRFFMFVCFIAALAACETNDDGNGYCSNPIAITGTPSTGYIVSVKDGEDPSLIATEYIETYGGGINVYTTSSTIFAAEMTGTILTILQCDARIKAIEYDGIVSAN